MKAGPWPWPKSSGSYELIDAARSERLIAAGMIGLRVRVPALNVADREIIAFDYEWADRGVDDVLDNPRQAVHWIAPPFPHVLAPEPFPEQRQVGWDDRANLVGADAHPRASFCGPTATQSHATRARGTVHRNREPRTAAADLRRPLDRQEGTIRG